MGLLLKPAGLGVCLFSRPGPWPGLVGVIPARCWIHRWSNSSNTGFKPSVSISHVVCKRLCTTRTRLNLTVGYLGMALAARCTWRIFLLVNACVSTCEHRRWRTGARRWRS